MSNAEASRPADTSAEIEATTLGRAVALMTRALAEAGLDTPALDARRLVAWALGLEPVALLREPERPLSEADRKRLAAVTARRLAREPVSRIEGRRGFHGLDLEIAASTLDPRPETETLVDAVLDLVRSGQAPGGLAPRILDLGTGSGAILIALLVALPDASGLGTDVSEDALAVAGRNAARAGVSPRATFRRSCWLADVDRGFDLVVSNPPYIPSGDIAGLEAEVSRFDPPAALDGGPDGLDAYRAIAADVVGALVPDGWVAVEIGAGQCEDVGSILSRAFAKAADVDYRIWQDLAGTPRCVAVRSRGRAIR